MGSSASKEEYAQQVFDQVVDKELHEKLKCDYGYENLVFQGGSTKGIAYAGAVKVLEDVGILDKIKRFAGTSVGSLTAMILAFGGNSVDLAWEARNNVQDLVHDSIGLIALPLNLIRNLGWNRGDRLQKYVCDIAERMTGNPNITFEELRILRGVELCVVVTNLTSCTIEYFHAKTTPDVPIPLAVKTSMTLPRRNVKNIFQNPAGTLISSQSWSSTEWFYCSHDYHVIRDSFDLRSEEEWILMEMHYTGTGDLVLLQPTMFINPFTKQPDICVDGFICKNYPIDAFDGWFLSMKTEDSFFHRVGSEAPQFEPTSPKTLGIKFFDAVGVERNFPIYMKRYGDELTPRPNTTLAKYLGERTDRYLEIKRRLYDMAEAARRFLLLIRSCDMDNSDTIDLEEFKTALGKVTGCVIKDATENKEEGDGEKAENMLTSEDMHRLFGDGVCELSVEELFSTIDENRDKEISYSELLQFMAKKGVGLRNLMTRSQARVEVDSITSFLYALFATYDHELEVNRLKADESERSIAIYTDYIRALDMKIGDKDKMFLIKVLAGIMTL